MGCRCHSEDLHRPWANLYCLCKLWNASGSYTAPVGGGVSLTSADAEICRCQAHVLFGRMSYPWEKFTESLFLQMDFLLVQSSSWMFLHFSFASDWFLKEVYVLQSPFGQLTAPDAKMPQQPPFSQPGSQSSLAFYRKLPALIHFPEQLPCPRFSIYFTQAWGQLKCTERGW